MRACCTLRYGCCFQMSGVQRKDPPIGTKSRPRTAAAAAAAPAATCAPPLQEQQQSAEQQQPAVFVQLRPDLQLPGRRRNHTQEAAHQDDGNGRSSIVGRKSLCFTCNYMVMITVWQFDPAPPDFARNVVVVCLGHFFAVSLSRLSLAHLLRTQRRTGSHKAAAAQASQQQQQQQRQRRQHLQQQRRRRQSVVHVVARLLHRLQQIK